VKITDAVSVLETFVDTVDWAAVKQRVVVWRIRAMCTGTLISTRRI
jgi:hypothetical protein